MSTATTAGHLIVAQLERAGIQRVYGVPGESFLDVLDGLHGSSIETVVTRHEGGAGFMALAEGRLTELPGVAMVTRGPGAANAFIAIHTAHQDATPMILFVGLIPVADRGRESFQEFDINAWFGSTAKKVVTLDDAASAARVVDDAIFTALSGRPGPVVIGLPEDVLVHAIESGTVEPRVRCTDRTGSPGPGRAWSSAWPQPRKPLIVVGGEGWDQESSEALAGWASRHGVPVLADFRAYDAVPHNSDAYAGYLGYARSDDNARRLDEADLLVFVGCVRADVLSDGYKRGLDAVTVVVNLDADLLGHFGRLDQHIPAHVASFSTALAATASAVQPAAGWLAEARADYEKFSTAQPDGGTGRGPRRRDGNPQAGNGRRRRHHLRGREPYAVAGPLPQAQLGKLPGRAAQRRDGHGDPGGRGRLPGLSRPAGHLRGRRRLLPDERPGNGHGHGARRQVHRRWWWTTASSPPSANTRKATTRAAPREPT